MNDSRGTTALPEWLALAASSPMGVLTEDEEIEDVRVLTGNRAPKWFGQLGIPQGWQLVALLDQPELPFERMAVHQPRGDGSSEATETISATGYTGYPGFRELLDNAARTLRALGARNVVTRVLPVPTRQWVAAVRASGIALVGDRPVWARDSRSLWVQQTSYVTGSEQPHAGRLIVHNLFVDAACRPRLGRDIEDLSSAVYEGFLATVSNQDCRA